jgi:hypothetical protein
MDGFKSSPKMQCFKEGGAVKYKSRHSEKSEMSEDIAQDKKVVKKAFAMHDKQEHPGEKTDLSKLKKGGRMKKKDGGCVGRYKAGGSIGMKKDSGDIKDIQKIKLSKPKKAAAPSKAAIKPAMSNIAEPAPDMGAMPPMMKKGGYAKKCAEGGSLKSVDAEENPGLAKLPTNVRNKMGYAKKGGEVKKMNTGGMTVDPMGQVMSNTEKMRLANRAKNRAMLSPMQQQELDAQEAAAAKAALKGQGMVSDSERGLLGKLIGRKKGGKAC